MVLGLITDCRLGNSISRRFTSWNLIQTIRIPLTIAYLFYSEYSYFSILIATSLLAQLRLFKQIANLYTIIQATAISLLAPIFLLFLCIVISKTEETTDFLMHTKVILGDLPNSSIISILIFAVFAANLVTAIITDRVIKTTGLERAAYYQLC